MNVLLLIKTGQNFQTSIFVTMATKVHSNNMFGEFCFFCTVLSNCKIRKPLTMYADKINLVREDGF